VETVVRVLALLTESKPNEGAEDLVVTLFIGCVAVLGVES